jgi:hypothetical protein
VIALEYYEGIFINYIRTFPLEKERMFNAIEYLIQQGSGGDILDGLSRKLFKDTNEEYFNRLKKEALTKEDGLLLTFKALLKWYETWKHSFSDFDIKNAKLKYTEQPLHTWLHCLLTGKQHIFQQLLGDEYVVIEKQRWESTQKAAKTATSTPESGEQKYIKDPAEARKIERLLKLYENDEKVRLKELLLGKKIALFHEVKWKNTLLEEIIKDYHLESIKQFSSIDYTNNPGIFDYYLFLTSIASHSAKFKLESRIPKEKLYLISSTNEKLVMEEFLKQLKGK